MKKIILAIVFVILLAVCVSAEGYDFGEGTVYYSFDHQTVRDYGKNGLHGSLVGDGAEYVDGLNGGYAVRTDNNSYVKIPVEATCLKDEMSVVVWFKTDKLNNTWNRIISTGIRGQEATPGILLGIFNHIDGNTQYLAVGIGADDGTKNIFHLISAPEGEAPYKFDDNEWHCLGYSAAGGICGLFLDGKLVFTFEYDVMNNSVNTYEETAAIGCYLYFDTIDEPFSGTVDEAYFIPGGMDEAKFAAYYEAEKSGSIKHENGEPDLADTEESTEGQTEAVSDTADISSADTEGKVTGADTSLTSDSAEGEDTSEKVEDDVKKVDIWLIVGIAAAVVVLAVVAVVIIRKKK